MKITFLIVLAARASTSSLTDQTTETPPGCRKLNTDRDWPNAEKWATALPGISPGQQSGDGKPGPDYRFQAKSYSDVQKAVDFARNNNIRVSIIATGHDQIGRSDSNSGLLIDLSLLRGVRVLESFTPTVKGVLPPLTNETNIVASRPGVQAAVTFGPALGGQFLNSQLAASGLFAIGGTYSTVAPSGGWGQSGGYGPLTAQYGLGVDQWLEAKVVTADGQLHVANEVSNPDLFWAIRGGGGGTFGVVVEATVKAYPTIPLTGFNWYLNSTKPPSTPEQLAKGITPISSSMKYVMSKLPELKALGISAYFYVSPSYVRCYAIHPGQTAGLEKANTVWGPILEKMQSYEGMTKYQTKPYEFSSYQDFFRITYGTIEQNRRPNEPPRWRGIFEYDSRLLAARHLQSPNFLESINGTRGNYGVLLVAPGTSVGSGADTSTTPAWRDAVIHFVGTQGPGLSIDNLRRFTPEMGSYINEGNYQEENWSQSFWGSNYPRLSTIKTKYDPDNVFWASPGINGDHMHTVGNRVCKAEYNPTMPSRIPPKTEKSYIANITRDRDIIFGKTEIIGAQFPAPGSFVGLQSKPIPW